MLLDLEGRSKRKAASVEAPQQEPSVFVVGQAVQAEFNGTWYPAWVASVATTSSDDGTGECKLEYTVYRKIGKVKPCQNRQQKDFGAHE
jgi:hypothetical protein